MSETQSHDYLFDDSYARGIITVQVTDYGLDIFLNGSLVPLAAIDLFHCVPENNEKGEPEHALVVLYDPDAVGRDPLAHVRYYPEAVCIEADDIQVSKIEVDKYTRTLTYYREDE